MNYQNESPQRCGQGFWPEPFGGRGGANVHDFTPTTDLWHGNENAFYEITG